MLRKSYVLRLLLVTILATMLFAPQASASSDTPTKVEFQTVADNGTLATCTLTLYAPYRVSSNVRAYGRVDCSAVVSSIRLVVELAKRSGSSGSGTVCNRYDATLYNVKYHYGWCDCYYSTGWQWQSRASGYAPGWSNYKQSAWTPL